AESSMGTVTINCQGSTRGDFQFVSGRDGISLANAHVETATASMGTVRSRDCEVDSIECRDALDCQNSKLGTVTLTIDPDQGATLDLSGSTITGPVTIRAPQSITFSGGHISIGGSSFTSFGGDCVDTCINTGDSNVPDWTADLVDEGETAKINGHIVTKKNGILVPAKKSRDETSVMTTAQLIESIRPVANMICRTGRLNYQGGEYKIDHGRIQVLKAPPGVTLTDAPAGVTTAKLPSAAIRIIGGSIKGNVIFEGCTGSITLTKDANVLGDIVGGSIVND
ncbi:MAG: hypothetical protein KDK78_10080, partial [Chlamydiia bacterium]|nr:hypothetical protein [Chlamydiia bacterium]